MKKKLKWLYPSIGLCLSFLLVIPLYAILQKKNIGIGGPAGECPKEDGEVPTILPDSEDCSKFYICSFGVAIECECPSGLLYDAVIEVCDYPENVNCIQRDEEW